MKFKFGSFLSKALLAVLPAYLTKGKLSASDAIQGVGSAAIDQVATDNPDKIK